MAQSISLTIHPSAIDGEFLTVSDAMHQVLDLVQALEATEGGKPKIVWRLTEAHTNSPPFTVTAMATPSNTNMSIALETSRVVKLFAATVTELLSGRAPDWIGEDVANPLRRILKRNLNGISQTDIFVPGEDQIAVMPTGARKALAALDIAAIEQESSTEDFRRTEMGTIESMVQGITRWNDRPALVVLERLSEKKVTCVLSDELAAQLGPEHDWAEVWDGRRLLVSGSLHFDVDGSLRRVDATDVEDSPWTDVSLADARQLDVLQGRTVREHLTKVWGESDG